MSFIPEKCRFIFNILESEGYECFVVGGCVRDKLRGEEPTDWDFTTNASPEDILRCFSNFKTIDVGKKFGTVCILSEGEQYEITTYRIDGSYTDSRHPDSVTFSSRIADDLSRRDFTMNSIAYNDELGFVDPFGGIKDIRDGVIRSTGDPYSRFSEDALRILRAIRFASKLGFTIEEETENALLNLKDKLSSVHPMRLRKELSGVLLSDNVSYTINKYRYVFSVIIPELSEMFDVKQNNPHHSYDVWNHTMKALEFSPKSELIRLSLLFHDIGKPRVITTDADGIDHFKKHQTVSADIARKVLSGFGYPRSTVDSVCMLVRYHDERFNNKNSDIRRVLSATGTELFSELLVVSKCDMLAQSDYLRAEKLAHHAEVEKEYKRIIASGECYSLKQLAINGDDLKGMGFSGASIGKALNILLRAVINNRVDNTVSELIRFAKSLPKE